MNFVLDVIFPKIVQDFLDFWDYFAFDFYGTISLGCIDVPGIPPFLLYITVTAFTPILIMIGIWVTFFVRVYVQTDISRGQRKRMFGSHVSLSMILAYVVLPPVVQILFRGIHCAQLASGEWYLIVDTSVRCSDYERGVESEEFEQILAWVTPLIFFYLNILTLFVVVLHRNREFLNPSTEDKEAAYHKREKDQRINAIKFLFTDYKCGYHYYEVADMIRRIIMVAILPFVSSPSARAGLGCCLASICCIAFREVLPYHDVTLNVLALGGLYQVLIFYGGAFVILSGAFNYSEEVLGGTLFLTNLMVVPLMMVVFKVSMHNAKRQQKNTNKLRTELLVTKAEDRCKFEKEWARLASEVAGSEERVLSCACKLASRYQSTAKQTTSNNSVDDLLAMAALAEEEFHTTMRRFVEGIGGLYDRGPLKQKARVKEKMYGECVSALNGRPLVIRSGWYLYHAVMSVLAAGSTPDVTLIPPLPSTLMPHTDLI